MKENQSKFSSFKRLWFIMLLSCIGALTSFAQERTVTGTVLDDMGEPAIGATVKVPGTGIGTMTDMDGNYTLKVPSDASQLEFSYMGMETQTLPITGGKVDIKLGQSSKQLEEVVVTGYGQTKKRDVVTSVASVGADQIKNIPVTTAAEALQGKLTGVSVTTTEGSPDADVQIRVRGQGSLTQSSDPLYIVDGFPVSNINDISPSDIQSMDVLKDAAATAIYGAQGANGVIIITTKDADVSDGKDDCKMQFHVDYTGYVGWKNISKKMKVLDAKEFAKLQYENAAFKAIGSFDADESTAKQYGIEIAKVQSKFNDYFDPFYAQSGVYQDDQTKIFEYYENAPYTDWQDETFGRTGINSNHSLSVSGGNKNATFNLSYNRIDDKAIMEDSEYSRDNISLKSKFKPFKNFTLGFTARYSKTQVWGAGSNSAEDKGSSSQSRLRNSVVYTPVSLFKNTYEGDDDETALGGLYDPIKTIQDNYKYKHDQKYTINGYLQYKFLKKFTARVEAGYENRDIVVDRFYGPTTYFARSTTGLSGKDGSSNLVYTDEKTTRFRNSNTFTYEDKFKGGHNLSVMVGEENVVNTGELLTLTGYGFDPKYTGEKAFNYLGQSAHTLMENYIDPTDNMLSIFGRAQYDYKGRYYATATMRADASTRFSSDNQWGYFPSAAVAWRLSDEPWMKSVARAAKLSNFKLRFSYGTAGNNNVDLGYLHQDYLTNTSTYITLPGVSTELVTGGDKIVAANPELKWETTVTRDLGFDYGFFQDRLSGTFDLYWNTTNDLICRYGITGGYNYQYRNIGSVENKGLEFSVKGVALDHHSKNLDYNLTLDANISFNKNKIKDLGGLGYIEEATAVFSTSNITYSEFYLTVGDPMGQILGYETDGWYKASDFDEYNLDSSLGTTGWLKDGKLISTPFSSKGAYPGLMKFKDKNGDGEITEADKTIIGNTLPLATGGFSISGNVGSKNIGMFDLSANFTYSIGNDVLNLNKVDYTTITSSDEKTSYRNSLTDVASGKRYSQFDANGQWIPGQYGISGTTGNLSGAAYQTMAQAMDAMNANASIWSPIMPAYAVTDYAVEDGSYLRLASLTVGYSLPEKWISKAHITKARVFFTASNLFVLTKYSGFDPEVDALSGKNPLLHGVDFSAYPKSRAFNFGLNLSF